MRTPLKTPYFLIDESKVIKNLELLKSVQERAGINILFALKAFAQPQLFPLFSRYLSGASVSSLNESQLVNDFWKQKGHVYCPAYTNETIEQLLEQNSHVIFNSLTQLERFKTRLSDQHVGLRVNPGYSEIETKLYDPASPDTRLGVALDDLDSIPEEVSGIHMHVMCENDSYTFERLLDHIDPWLGKNANKITWINFGGGHLITETNYDAEHFISIMKKFKTKYPHLTVYIEPGSAALWQTGDLHVTIEDTPKAGVAIMNASFTAHMPDCLEMPYKPSVKGENEKGQYEYIIGGTSCLAGDQIAGFKFDSPLGIGQELIFEDMIHYTLVKTTQFNGVDHPDVYLKTKEGDFVLIKGFGYMEYLSHKS